MNDFANNLPWTLKQLEEMRLTLRRADLWLQELTMRGISIRDLPESHRGFIREIYGWSGALVREETKLQVKK